MKSPEYHGTGRFRAGLFDLGNESARCYNSLGAPNAKSQNYKEALDNYHKQLDILLELEPSENV
ncbi:unnamed protein product, partial [Adineta steineri]